VINAIATAGGIAIPGFTDGDEDNDD